MTNPDTSAPVVESAPATFTQQQVLDALNEAAKTAHIGSRFDHLNAARQYPLGRKEARQLAAETAELGTEWEDLLH